MQEKDTNLTNDNENFVIFLADSKLPIYKKPEVVKRKKANDIKASMNLKKNCTLAIRTPNYIQYADPMVVMTDDFPELITNKRFDFSYAIQIVSVDDINSVQFIFQCEVDNILPDTSTPIQMPNIIVQFYYDEFYKKTGKDVLHKIVNVFDLPIENPQLFINDEVIDINILTAIEIFKRFRSNKNRNIFKCHLTDEALEIMEKRVNPMKEFITNETIYLERLNYLFNFFTSLLKNANVFEEKTEKYQEFNNCIRKIFKYHTSFFLELKNMKIDYSSQISKVFLNLDGSYSINQDFIRQYANLRSLMSEIKSNGKLKHVRTSVFSPEKIDLNEFIEIPFRQPLMYLNIIKKIISFTPKSHIDYGFLRIAESKMKSLCSLIDSFLDKMRNSFELISLIKRIDQTSANKVSITGQSLKASFEVLVRSKDFTIKRPGMIFLLKDKILCTLRNGFGKTTKENVVFYNKIKTQSFILSSDLKMDSILFIGDAQNSYNLTFESKEKRDEFVLLLREIRQNLIVTKPLQIYAEEILPSSFTKVPPPQMYGLSSAVLSDTLIFFSGGVTEGKKERCSPFVTFDAKSNECSTDAEFLTPGPEMRMTCSSSHVKGKSFVSFYLFGGRKMHQVMIYDQKTWVEMPGKSPLTRIKHSLVTYENNLVVFGGLDEKDQARNELLIYNVENHDWKKFTTKGENPPPRFDHSAVIYKNVMIIHGGQVNDTKLSDTWIFNFTKLEWSQAKIRKNSSIVPRSGHAAVIVNQFMIVFGGEGYNNLPFALNIETMKIIRLKFVGNYICGMNNFAAAVVVGQNDIEKQIICFGGLSNDSAIINSFTRLYLPEEITHPDQLPSENEID